MWKPYYPDYSDYTQNIDMPDIVIGYQAVNPNEWAAAERKGTRPTRHKAMSMEEKLNKLYGLRQAITDIAVTSVMICACVAAAGATWKLFCLLGIL